MAMVDEDKLTTQILMSVDDVEFTVLEGEDACIDFYYRGQTTSAPSIYDPIRGWDYQLSWKKGSDNDLTYDEMDQGVKAGSYLLKICDNFVNELPVMEVKDAPDIMRQNAVSEWNGQNKTTFFPIFIKGNEVLITISYHT